MNRLSVKREFKQRLTHWFSICSPRQLARLWRLVFERRNRRRPDVPGSRTRLGMRTAGRDGEWTGTAGLHLALTHAYAEEKSAGTSRSWLYVRFGLLPLCKLPLRPSAPSEVQHCVFNTSACLQTTCGYCCVPSLIHAHTHIHYVLYTHKYCT